MTFHISLFGPKYYWNNSGLIKYVFTPERLQHSKYFKAPKVLASLTLKTFRGRRRRRGMRGWRGMRGRRGGVWRRGEEREKGEEGEIMGIVMVS